MKDIQTEEDIKTLVDKFYQRVLKDDVIGYLFTDVVQLSWEKHIPIMYSFWSSILLGTKTYEGNPMGKHIEIDKIEPLTQKHFEHWLYLWQITIAENFEGEVADEALNRAKSIAALIQYRIEKSH